MTTTRDAMEAQYHTLSGRQHWFESEARALGLRALARALAPCLPRSPGVAILDIGCGEGALLALLRSMGHERLDAFDISPENVELCNRQGFRFVSRHDALSLETFRPRKRYGAVYCIDVLEHLPMERVVPFLAAARSRLQPGGFLAIQTPNLGSLLGLHARYADVTHEWGATEKSIVDLLAAAGFDRADIRVWPAWSAATLRGRARELYLRFLHRLVFLAEDSSRPRIPTKNLVVRAQVP